MTRISKLGLCSLVVGALAVTGSRAQAQASPNPDSTSANRGEKLWTVRGCNTCHNLSHTGKMSGPDLAGIVQNRDRDWLRQFLKNTDEMLKTDPMAVALLKKWKGAKMPDQHLSDSEVEALINYLETQTHS
jgi:cytochrome c2